MNWISVKDELPDSSVARMYNCCCVGDVGHKTYSLWFKSGRWHFDNWLTCGDPTFTGSFYIEVTHWMPLPEPPKEEQ